MDRSRKPLVRQSSRPSSPARPRRRAPILVAGLAVVALIFLGVQAPASDDRTSARYQDDIQPVLAEFCYRCHADGVAKGSVSLDASSDEALFADRELWGRVLKNVRAGIMPPADKPRPSREQVEQLAGWIKTGVLGIDPSDPDPGRATIRRLNRVEYRNTIRDLMDVDYRTDEEFPPDDTGYGFDNIADVLTVSPLLLEKYMEAAETIVARGVPTVSKVVQTRTYSGDEFRGPDAKGERLSFYKPAKVSRNFKAPAEGTYRLTVVLDVRGAFDFDPGRCRVTLKIGDRPLLAKELGWGDGRGLRFDLMEEWVPGDYPLTFELEPLTDPKEKTSTVDLHIASVVVEGPLEPKHWQRPKNFDRFFTRDDPGPGPERRPYARETLARFAARAYRRPVDDRTLDRLVAIAEELYSQPGKSVEQGIAQGMIAVLSSPRFLFRVEEIPPSEAGQRFPLVDEYTLASRLSYFLWSTMPDDELRNLAARGELRQNLRTQIKRLLDDRRSDRMIRNFTGQWLQARDVEGIAINARSVLARDAGEEKELQREVDEFRAFLAKRQAEFEKAKAEGKPPPRPADDARRRFRRIRTPRVDFDGPLREAMRRESEMFFEGIVRDDRSLLDLLDSDYTYLNEKLAKHYGIPDVTGEHMRRVTLPADSPRGGLLTQGTILVVTSNPTRTSPVKRGLFLLDNILGTPPPPPPPEVAALEDAEKAFKDREPTLREVLEIHRGKPLCNACHSRMDPLGLALENFNAMGMWRDKERGQPLDTAGKLITGESFADVRDLKRILRNERRTDFYRCVTEKMLTYAVGRGPELSDVETVDRIVDQLERENGRFTALSYGIIESAPFQKRRNGSAVSAIATGRTEPAGQTAPSP